MSRPKPVRLEWRNATEAKLLGASIREGEAIYVWLHVGDTAEPRAYVLPWNMEMAQQLQEGMGPASRTAPVCRYRISSNPEPTAGRQKFYAPPQPRLPPKRYGDRDTIVYHGRTTAAIVRHKPGSIDQRR